MVAFSLRSKGKRKSWLHLSRRWMSECTGTCARLSDPRKRERPSSAVSRSDERDACHRAARSDQGLRRRHWQSETARGGKLKSDRQPRGNFWAAGTEWLREEYHDQNCPRVSRADPRSMFDIWR